MARGRAFADVLEEVLEGSGPNERVSASRAGFGYATPSILFFEAGLPSAGRTSFVAPPAPPPPPPPRPRPRHALSPRQQEALDAFVELGARIDDGFTHAELRSVFRSLALRYHPDRHPASGDRERAHLSERFAQLHDAYDSLKSVSASSN
jgi:hypothetical protein